MTFDFAAVHDILRCPKSRSALVAEDDSLVSTDPACRLRYKIIDGIPILLADEATELPLAEWSHLMQRHGRCPLTGEALQ